jgi:uncharacterized protein YjbI with pentapeptide repeats
MLGSVLAVVVVALVIAAVATLGLGFLLFGWHFWRDPVPRPAGDAGLTDPVKIALTIVAGVGGVVALVVSYRKQAMAERVENRDRYGAAVTQLGNLDPTVRLAGVYAMANLADEWKSQRQQCVDVLCAYLRMPWDPTAQSQHPLATRTIQTTRKSATTTLAYRDPHGEYQVRATILRIIRDHVTTPEWHANRWGKRLTSMRLIERGGLWSALSFDFAGAQLADVDLTDAVFTGRLTSFERATFSGVSTFFDGAIFANKTTWFTRAVFLGKATSFMGARFFGAAGFAWTAFSDGATSFDGARFSGLTFFDHARFPGEDTSFSGATFLGRTSFANSKFSGGATRFVGVTFSVGAAVFETANFSGKSTNFNKATFSGALADFRGVTFTGESSFTRSTFSARETCLDKAVFVGGTVRFNDANFSGAVTGHARFSTPRNEVFQGASIDPDVLNGWTFDPAAPSLSPEMNPLPAPERESPMDRGTPSGTVEGPTS